MRTHSITIAIVGSLVLLGAVADAGEALLTGMDQVVAPGGTANATLKLVNDGGKPARFKVSVRVQGLSKKVKGKKVKVSVRLEPGETRDLDLEVPVPANASGPVLLAGKVRWPKGRVEIARGITSSRGGGEDSPDPEGSRPGIPTDKAVELTGTVSLDVPESYGDRAYPAPGIWPGLLLETVDGDEWTLLGEEAYVLTELMIEAGLRETSATIVGIPGDDVPVYGAEGEEVAKALRDRNPRKMRWLWVLEFEARGVTDPRKKIVPHRYVLEGSLSKIAEAKELVIDTPADWERLLADAGIRLPEKPELPPWWSGDPTSGAWIETPGRPGVEFPELFFPWDVNFRTETVIAVFAGEKRSTGFRVQILRVTKEDEGYLLVSYALVEPSEFEVVVGVPTQPFAIVAIPKAEARIRFELTDPPDDGWPVLPAGGYGVAVNGVR